MIKVENAYIIYDDLSRTDYCITIFNKLEKDIILEIHNQAYDDYWESDCDGTLTDFIISVLEENGYTLENDYCIYWNNYQEREE